MPETTTENGNERTDWTQRKRDAGRNRQGRRFSAVQRLKGATLTDVLSIKPAQTSVVSYGAGTNSTAMLVGLHERAELTSVKGLGRSFAWADLVKHSEAQLDLFSHTTEIPCGCFDG
jgi:hypothetical protein